MPVSPRPLPPGTPRNPHRRLLKAIALLLLCAFAYLGASAWLLWSGVDELRTALTEARLPATPYPPQNIRWTLGATHTPKDGGKARSGNLTFTREAGKVLCHISIEGRDESPLGIWQNEEGRTVFHSLGTGATFQSADADWQIFRKAITDAAAPLPRLSLKDRLALTLYSLPRITGVSTRHGRIVCNLSVRQGELTVFANGVPLQSNLRLGPWQIQTTALPKGKIDPPPATPAETVPGDELMQALAEAIRIGTYAYTPLTRPPEGVTRSGKGWMQVRDGHRQLYLSGTPHEIGYQHGQLAGGEAVERMARRLVYGVGLLYSIKQKEWFPTAAKGLVERQRRFIHPDYFEEMRGLAEGAGVSLGLIQMMNIFPEFFHCSGVALMGDATKDGGLLHARVLDYMVGVGLQDAAAVMAIERLGKHRFVTVGYLGFIGSVTGMNEHQVAIGEMGGAGQGDWDGIPMSLLIRQSLEDYTTLEEVETFMRESPRTCEYYYLITDGKGPKALGIAATPATFETFGPGAFHERLPLPVDDAVLLSGRGRYEKLVERVRNDYGSIDLDGLIRIIKRPVAMKSNLHNVIFQPEKLSLVVADAGRSSPACNEPYRLYTWDALFSASSSGR